MISRRKLLGFLFAAPVAATVATKPTSSQKGRRAWIEAYGHGFWTVTEARSMEDDGVVTLTWDPVPGATHYRLYQRREQ